LVLSSLAAGMVTQAFRWRLITTYPMQSAFLTSAVARRPVAAALLACLAITHSLPAQTPPAEAAKETTLELSPFTVTAESDRGYGATTAYTATRIGVPILETPLNVQVVTRQLMDDQGVRSLLQSLAYTSGLSGDSLSFAGGNQNSSGSGSTIRGFIPTLILQNGFRRSAAIGAGGDLSVENAERVEVVKGPASVFFGQAAPGGLINIITRKPTQKKAAELEYSLGNYEFNKAKLNLTGPVAGRADLEYRFFVSHEDSEDWRDYTYTKMTVVNPSIRWHPTSDLAVTLEYEYIESRRNFVPYSPFGSPQFLADWTNPPAAVLSYLGLTAAQAQARWIANQAQYITDVTKATGTVPFRITSYLPDLSPRGLNWNPGGPDSFTGRRSHNLTLETTYRLSDLISLRYGGNYYVMRNRRIDASIAIPRGDRTINLALQNNRGKDEWQIHQIDLLLTKDLPFVKNKVTLGMQHSREAVFVQNATFDTSAAPGGATTVTAHNPYTMAPIRLSALPYTWQPIADGSEQRNFTRGYGAAWFGQWFSERLTTMAGVRKEYDIRERLRSASGLPTLKRNATVPSYGANLRVADGIALFASYSENFAPNGIRSAEGPGLLPTDNAHDLPVELGKGWDAGVKTDWMNHKLSGSLSLFQVERTNVPRADTAKQAADPRNLAGLFGPTGVRFNTSGGLERSRGLELDFVYTPATNYQIMLSGTWMWEAKVISDPSVVPGTFQYDRTFNQGRRLRNAPEYLASLWQKYDFGGEKSKGWSIAGGIRYSSEVEPRATDLTSLMYNPAYTVGDVMIGYRTRLGNRPTQFALNVQNVFNKVYYDGNTGAASPRKFALTTRIQF